MIEGQNFFEPVKNNLKTCNTFKKTEAGQEDDYTTACLLDYNYLKDFYKNVSIDLSTQKAQDANPKAIQQTNFTRNPENNATIFFIIKEVK